MVAVNLLQVKKGRWGELSQISQSKLSAPKYCEYFSKVHHLRGPLLSKFSKNLFFLRKNVP